MHLEQVCTYMVKRYAQSNMWPSTSLWTKCFWSSSSMRSHKMKIVTEGRNGTLYIHIFMYSFCYKLLPT